MVTNYNSVIPKQVVEHVPGRFQKRATVLQT